MNRPQIITVITQLVNTAMHQKTTTETKSNIAINKDITIPPQILFDIPIDTCLKNRLLWR